MSTILFYLDHMHDLEGDAVVERVDQQADRSVVYLDQTILYPQGGGQPYDKGVIQGSGTKFIVEEVRFMDGEVLHFGHFEGQPFMPGEDVHIVVDAERRQLNTRLHSGGHLVDMAVNQLGFDWTPGKGYHFPDSPFVEYGGQLDAAKQAELQAEIEKTSNELIGQDLPVTCRFVEIDELHRLCRHVPENIPTNKPSRVVQFADFAIPCGGTHVKSLAEIGHVGITKLKQKGDNIIVGYQVS